MIIGLLTFMVIMKININSLMNAMLALKLSMIANWYHFSILH